MSQPLIDDNELTAFDVYFASVASLQFHPGSGTREHTALTLPECRDKALEMLALRRGVIHGEG